MFWIAEIILYDFNIIVVNTNLCDLSNYKKKTNCIYNSTLYKVYYYSLL